MKTTANIDSELTPIWLAYRLSDLMTLANGSNVQDFSYTYDAVGNITQIANPASASSSATTIFTYDALNRLLQASTTAASSTPYKQQYEYDSLGDVLTWATNGAASNIYTYAKTGNANPHAVTEIGNGNSTTTYSYDANGNLAQKVTDGVTSTYVWDYANRLMALGVNNSTSTYGYNAFGARVYQIASTTATTTYAFKWYSVASSTRSGTNYATSTEYLFSGDTLLSTIDQAFTNGAAIGTASVRYIHPDHLGSTNIVTNADGTAVVQTLDYYPYGAVRINSNAQGADVDRKYINRFADQSNLSYLNARYYDPARGQFVSEDPIFLLLGSPQAEKMANRSMQQILIDPQGLNSYSYSKDNPIAIKDPSGLISQKTAAYLNAVAPLLSRLVVLLGQLIAATGGGASVGNPAPATISLAARSTTTVEPGPLVITPSNQRSYGGVITQIQKSPEFNTYVDEQIKKRGHDGTLNIPADNPQHSFSFSSGDLHTALNKVNAGLSGRRSEDGTWNIHVTIQDTYNFEPNNYSGGYSDKTIATLNNSAVVAQQLGVVSTYPIDIGFDYTYKPQ